MTLAKYWEKQLLTIQQGPPSNMGVWYKWTNSWLNKITEKI